MALMKILTYPDKFLKTTTKPVENIDTDLQQIINDMAETMYAAPGAGLAATQVGIDKSIMVYDGFPGEEKQSVKVMINPVILESSGTLVSENEGCLSVLDYTADVKRASHVLVECLDRDGNPLKFEAEGYLAIVLQHEIDHLNGILFIDRISSLKRQIYKKRIKKKQNNNE